MSLLAPLYFLGALAISLPILFHLIRRQPRGHVEFSSLMFLQPTPPRLTRRSRLDNWPLLLIRAVALMLLAAAFARPFLRSAALSDAELPGRRLVLMVDTSASMQRAGMWQQALDKANEVIDDVQAADRLAIVTFDSQPQTLMGFDESERLPVEQLKMRAKGLISGAAPTWMATDLGRALSFAADLGVSFESGAGAPSNAESVEAGDSSSRTAATRPAHLVLISDLQEGSQVESLQVYAWPKDLRLDVRKVAAGKRTNASALILADTPDADADQERVRVRVSNSADATESRFRIRWSRDDAPGTPTTGAANSAELQEMPVLVPRGESRVVRMPTPLSGVTSLVLQGDDHSFDNTRYVVAPQPESLSLWHLGDQAAEPRDSLLHFLQRVPLSNPQRTVTVESYLPKDLPDDLDPESVPLIVLERSVDDPVADRLGDYAARGGRLLVVLAVEDTAAGAVASVNRIAESELRVSEAVVDDYAMFSKINFRHALFESMADPKFNDFSKIRFWSHRRLSNLDDAWNVVAGFDDGDPALLERELGDGSIVVLAAGWQPTGSQLALSTKFIPLVFSLFDSRPGGGTSDRYVVGEPIDFEPSETARITNPAGTAFSYRSPQDLERIDQPGVYQFVDGETTRTFAVNLNESESRTEALREDELERFGVLLGKNLTTEQALAQQRQLRDRELENSQKIWQWLLVAAIALLALETILGAMWSRRRVTQGLELEGT